VNELTDEIVERCIERLLDGDSMESVLASYADAHAALLPLLETAQLLVRVPSARPSRAPRRLALSRMLAQLSVEKRRRPRGGFPPSGAPDDRTPGSLAYGRRCSRRPQHHAWGDEPHRPQG